MYVIVFPLFQNAFVSVFTFPFSSMTVQCTHVFRLFTFSFFSMDIQNSSLWNDSSLNSSSVTYFRSYLRFILSKCFPALQNSVLYLFLTVFEHYHFNHFCSASQTLFQWFVKSTFQYSLYNVFLRLFIP